jgi:hypothetical protein
VLSLDAPATAAPPVAAKPRAPAANPARPSTATPIVSKPLSRFTVTVEFIELVTPAEPKPEAPAETAPAPGGGS